MTCLCGVTMDIYNSSTDLLVDTVDFNVYNDGTNNFFETTETTIWSPGVTSPIRIDYDSVNEQWEMSYFSTPLSSTVVFGVLPSTTSPCPTSMCDWDLDCISFRLVPESGTAIVVTWGGQYINGKKVYKFTSNLSGSNINYEIYYNTTSGRWTFRRTDTGVNVAELTDGTLACPLGNWQTLPGPGTFRVATSALGVSGYYIKVYDKECGCCDQKLNLAFTYAGNSYTPVASIVLDEFGNTLGFNGYPYYSFSITYLGTPMIFYLFFKGDKWAVAQTVSNSAATFTLLNSTNECPFGPYLSGGLFDRFSVTGTECFDCCDYYTPRFSNFIKKKKYELVEDIDTIRPKELFGLKCGPEWSTLFKHHLIMDVLHCLPYGVLCEESEQCLMNNLSENCNC
jgi:hypothetical protein